MVVYYVDMRRNLVNSSHCLVTSHEPFGLHAPIQCIQNPILRDRCDRSASHQLLAAVCWNVWKEHNSIIFINTILFISTIHSTEKCIVTVYSARLILVFGYVFYPKRIGHEFADGEEANDHPPSILGEFHPEDGAPLA